MPGYAYGPGGPGHGWWGPGWTASAGNGRLRKTKARTNQTSPNASWCKMGSSLVPNSVISELKSPLTSAANEMRSATVFANNAPGNGVGQIKRVMNSERGEVAFVLIERGGFLGLEPRWYAVPVEALVWAPYEGGYRLTVNEQLLNSEPSLQPHTINAPVNVPANQLAQLYQRFGMTPYWALGSAQSEPNPPTIVGETEGSSGSSQPSANNR